MRISVAILTGGKSRRMGQDKALCSFSGNTFLGTLVKSFSSYDDLIISVAPGRQYAIYAGRQIEDEYEGKGPLEGLRQCLLHAVHEYVFVCAVDMPQVNPEVTNYLLQQIHEGVDAVVFTEKSLAHPLCAIYARSALPILEEQIQKNHPKMTDLLDRIHTIYLPVEGTPINPCLLANINCQEDWAALSSQRKKQIFCISGVKNCGKTTLIEKLLPIFSRQGYRVAVIKHDGHDYEADRENTDTYKYRMAGAQIIGIFSPNQNTVFEIRENTQLEEMLAKMPDADIILIEGMKNTAYPRIEILRPEIEGQLTGNPASLAAVAAESPEIVPPNKRFLPLNDPEAIAHFVIHFPSSNPLGQKEITEDTSIG